MTLTTIGFQGLIDAFGGADLTNGWVTAKATRPRIAGPAVTLPSRLRLKVTAGVPAEPLVLERPDGWAWRLEFQATRGSAQVRGYYIWPDVASIDWGDLTQVAPSSLDPIPEGSTALQILADAEQARDDAQEAAGNAASSADQAQVDMTSRLEKAQNLDDLPDKDAARSNLGIFGPTQVDVVESSAAWALPEGGKTVEVFLIGGGGGGASGRRGAAATARGGGGGGGGAGLFYAVIDADDLPASAVDQVLGFSVVIGAGGAGGAARTTDDTNGANGGTGGATILYDPSGVTMLLGLGGGNRGSAGSTAGGGAGPGGTGTFTGGAGAAGSAGGAASAGSPGQATGGGGGGAGIDAANAPGNGGGGAAPSGYLAPGMAAAGGIAGASGASGGDNPYKRGGAGGGGGSSTAAGPSGNGGAGGKYGGAGGGGAASVNGVASGAGGAGAPGVAIFITHF